MASIAALKSYLVMRFCQDKRQQEAGFPFDRLNRLHTSIADDKKKIGNIQRKFYD